MSLIKLTRDANEDLHWVDPVNGIDLAAFRQSTSDLYVPQGFARGRTVVSDANATVFATTSKICFTALTAARTVTLPAPSSCTNHSVTIKDESGAAGTYHVTVSVTAGGTIDGASSVVLSTNYGALHLYSNGSAWFTE